MNYVFFGGSESEFAQIILDKLTADGYPTLAAIRNAHDSLDIIYLKSLKADFFLVASFGKILKKDLLEIPAKGVIGVHPSLLPKYRGASPIQSVILANEKETGTCLYIIDEKVDHGPVLANSELRIMNNDNYESLLKKLAELSADLILKTVPSWLAGKIQPQIQDESRATFTKKFITEDALVDLQKDSPRKIWLTIRALNPEPGTFTVLKLKNGKDLRLKLLKADFQNDKLELLEVQPEGKRIMSYKEFLNGYQKLID